jgi:uncharacterized protein (DUF433 family)
MRDQVASVASEALLAPGGHYPTWRAAQLSGVPERALDKWIRRRILVPDFASVPPSWTYRDLIFARMLAWLLRDGAPPWQAAQRVALAKAALAPGGAVDPSPGVAAADAVDSPDGADEQAPDPGAFVAEFVLDASSGPKELGKRDLWGPDLRFPSPRTFIDPTVEHGEPCVRGTTISTRALLALRAERGIDSAAIPALYEGLEPEDVLDALDLEARLRGDAAQR